MGFMKAVYDVVQSGKENTKLYPVLVNDISRLGSIKILDRMMEDDFYSYVYDKYQERLSK